MIGLVSLFGIVAAITSAPAGTPQTVASPPAVISHDRARQIVVGCGLNDGGVTVAYEQDLQEDVIWIATSKEPVSDAILVCVARASLQTIHYVYFREEAEQKRYDLIYSRIENETEVAEAKAWLAKRNLLSTMPEPKQGSPLSDFSRAVEAFCGVRPGSLLVASSDRLIAFTKDGLGHITSHGVVGAATTSDQFECVMKVMSAADLRARGIVFGLIGNAATTVR